MHGRSLLGLSAAATVTALVLAGAPATAATAATKTTVDYPRAHWLAASSTNFTKSTRPTSYPIQYVVIHVTQETYPDTLAIFQDPARRVSAHYVVRSSDGYLTQMVREADIAWQAGNWDYNTRSIGIEHEGWVDQPAYFTDAMYRSSAALVRYICDKYRIPKDRAHVIGHNEVPGATHTDPGPNWDWNRYLSFVRNPNA